MQSDVTKNCALCQGEKIKKLFVSQNTHGRHLLDSEDVFDVFSCLECGCVFLGKLDTDSEYYEKYYELGYYEAASTSFISKLLNVLSTYLVYRKQNLILAFLKKKENISVLDVGCGSGGFLLKLDAKKFAKRGVEINPEGVDACRKSGLEVYSQNLLDIHFEQRFDVITSWHVLEHLSNPVEMLKKLHSALSDDGIFIFEVPNTDSLGFKYGQDDWFHLDSPRHLMLYNKKSIEKLCELTGFKVVSVRSSYFDFPLDLFWSLRKSALRFLVYPFYPIAKCVSKETLTFVCKKI